MNVISSLVNVIAIVTMWIPSGCVYVQSSGLLLGSRRLIIVFRYATFQTLAYLVKLNMEMFITRLIKKIAMNHSLNSDQFIIRNSQNSTFKCCTQDFDLLPPTR
jgi:hypothetical protein